MASKNQWWIGVDIDKTLAYHTRATHGKSIGEPVPKMVRRVKKWLAEGKKIKIFTARVSKESLKYNNQKLEDAIELINDWCIEHLGRCFEVTCEKDYWMLELWDDRARQVIPNSGARYNIFSWVFYLIFGKR